MKRMFLSMLAAVTLFASCSQEEVVSQQQATGEESLVSFTVTTPQLGSRAAAVDGDGTKATNLYYAVYDETIGEIVEPISKMDENVTLENKKRQIELPLLNGHKYSLIFWAENEACPYTVNWEEKTITLDANATLKSNQEVYDAFYAYVEPFVVTGHKMETVTLYRPFAQLNIATSQRDLDDVETYYGLSEDIKATQIVVTTPTAMDLTTGNAYDEKELTYALAEFENKLFPATGVLPATKTEKLESEVDGLGDVDVKDEYVAISLNYLLVSAEKQLVDIKMSCGGTTEFDDLDREFKNVPVQRNYRTNIFGNLYTSHSVWNVVIEPEFDGALSAADQLAAVFEKGGEVTLYTDVELTEPLVLKGGKEVTINLNGQTIDAVNGSDAFVVNGGTLIINGEGEINTEDNTPAYGVFVDGQNAVAKIYGGTYSIGLDNVAQYGTTACNSAVYTKNGGKAYIYGGTFQVVTSQTAPDEVSLTRFLLNRKDQSNPEAGGELKVYGGTFVKFNPADNAAEGEHTNFVADGYSSVKVGDNYIVTEGTAVADAAGLATALAGVTEDVTITLAANIDLADEPLTVNSDKNITINLNGNSITRGVKGSGDGSSSYAILNTGSGTLNIEGNGIIKTSDAYYSIAVWAKSGTVNIYGGEYYNAGDGCELIYASATGNINIYGGTFKATSKLGVEEATANPYTALNVQDAAYNNNTANITVYGGKYYKFNPADNKSEGANTNFVADDYQSTLDGDWWVVTEE